MSQKIFQIKLTHVLTLLSLLFASTSAMAHPGHEQLSLTAGLFSGFLHPLVGLDHLLVLFALGYVSHSLEGNQRWILPLTFVGLMAVGFVVAHAGIHLVSAGAMETMITISLVLAMVLLVVNNHGVKLLKPLSGRFSVWFLPLFAIFHGLAHGYEIPHDASATTFGLAFAAASLSITFVASWLAKGVTRFKVSYRVS